jgi:acetoin utilization deacetylase AcuC-like enzyme
MKVITDQRCTEFESPIHPEGPRRITGCLETLQAQRDLPLVWDTPVMVTQPELLRAHSAAHLNRLDRGEAFDNDTPVLPDIASHAKRSAGGAMAALQSTLAGETGFSLMRPPGHHAKRNQAMGFCYLNNVALAVLAALQAEDRRIAVFDFDVHHGNGTEAILMDHPRCAVFSVHQYPAYPSTGKRSVGNSYNYPVPPETPREIYRDTLQRALDDMIAFQPNLIAVSAGFDAYRGDPLAEELLEVEDYYWLGHALYQTRIPVFNVLEGGYSPELPQLLLAYLNGLAGK